MHRSNLLLFAILALCLASTVGCGGPEATARKKLIGKWELATEELQEALKKEMAKKTEGDAQGKGAAFGSAMMEQLMAQMKMSMDFQEDGKVSIFRSGMGRKEGTWEVLSVSGSDVTLKIITDESEEEPSKLTFVDDDTIKFVPEGQEAAPGGMKDFIFRRAK